MINFAINNVQKIIHTNQIEVIFVLKLVHIIYKVVYVFVQMIAILFLNTKLQQIQFTVLKIVEMTKHIILHIQECMDNIYVYKIVVYMLINHFSILIKIIQNIVRINVQTHFIYRIICVQLNALVNTLLH